MILVAPVRLAALRWSVTLFLLSGCASAGSARRYFSSLYSCPVDRVTVEKRKHTRYPERAPPAEIANDPERATMWRAEEIKRNAAVEGYPYYVVTGCGQTRMYLCYECDDCPTGASCAETAP
jgi:hypothetical protein